VINAVSFNAVSEMAIVPDSECSTPTLIGALSWPNAARIDEALRAAAPPACMNCLRSIPSPVHAHIRGVSLQYKFCAIGLQCAARVVWEEHAPDQGAVHARGHGSAFCWCRRDELCTANRRAPPPSRVPRSPLRRLARLCLASQGVSVLASESDYNDRPRHTL